MPKPNPIHPHFQAHLKFKSPELIELYTSLRLFVLSQYPDCNELLYHTHALTSLYTISEKMGDAFCMINIYSDHLNLGFNKGAVLDDPAQMLQGTGKWIRHIPINVPNDYQNDAVKALLQKAISLSIEDNDMKSNVFGQTISKIK